MKIASVATLERTADATTEKIARNSTKINFSRFFSTAFSAVALPVQEWLQLRFSSRASDATKLEKNASPARAEIAGVAAALGLRYFD